MNTAFKKAFEHKVIYVFTVDDEAHRGLVKIGDATLHTDTPIDALPPNCKELNQAALTRIRSYTNTAGLTPKLLHTEVAVRAAACYSKHSVTTMSIQFCVTQELRKSKLVNPPEKSGLKSMLRPQRKPSQPSSRIFQT